MSRHSWPPPYPMRDPGSYHRPVRYNIPLFNANPRRNPMAPEFLWYESSRISGVRFAVYRARNGQVFKVREIQPLTGTEFLSRPPYNQFR